MKQKQKSKTKILDFGLRPQFNLNLV